jgi:hypothetical protein
LYLSDLLWPPHRFGEIRIPGTVPGQGQAAVLPPFTATI